MSSKTVTLMDGEGNKCYPRTLIGNVQGLPENLERVDALVKSLSDGAATDMTEVIDARNVDGVTYASLNQAINSVNDKVDDSLRVTINQLTNTFSDFISTNDRDELRIVSPHIGDFSTTPNSYNHIIVNLYDKNKELLSEGNILKTNNEILNISEAEYIKIKELVYVDPLDDHYPENKHEFVYKISKLNISKAEQAAIDSLDTTRDEEIQCIQEETDTSIEIINDVTSIRAKEIGYEIGEVEITTPNDSDTIDVTNASGIIVLSNSLGDGTMICKIYDGEGTLLRTIPNVTTFTKITFESEDEVCVTFQISNSRPGNKDTLRYAIDKNSNSPAIFKLAAGKTPTTKISDYPGVKLGDILVTENKYCTYIAEYVHNGSNTVVWSQILTTMSQYMYQQYYSKSEVDKLISASQRERSWKKIRTITIPSDEYLGQTVDGVEFKRGSADTTSTGTQICRVEFTTDEDGNSLADHDITNIHIMLTPAETVNINQGFLDYNGIHLIYLYNMKANTAVRHYELHVGGSYIANQTGLVYNHLNKIVNVKKIDKITFGGHERNSVPGEGTKLEVWAYGYWDEAQEVSVDE